jgi:hypothetical protein
MVDKSTCVRAASNPCLGDDLFSIKQGSNLTIDITILCKAGNNVIYILAKWDNKEYHGVITGIQFMYLCHIYYTA